MGQDDDRFIGLAWSRQSLDWKIRKAKKKDSAPVAVMVEVRAKIRALLALR